MVSKLVVSEIFEYIVYCTLNMLHSAISERNTKVLSILAFFHEICNSVKAIPCNRLCIDFLMS